MSLLHLLLRELSFLLFESKSMVKLLFGNNEEYFSEIFFEQSMKWS